VPASCCELTDNAFAEEDARGDLKAYRKRGPARQTRLILDGIRGFGLKDASLLDIGGGIGAIYHELLGDVARQAVHVDASAAYLRAAREETERRGNQKWVQFIHADFTEVVHDLAAADVVSLDRVVCCYPDFRLLLAGAADKCGRVLALTYPRETWYVRLGLFLVNLFQRLRRDPFRAFLHPVSAINALLSEKGFQRVRLRRLFIWEAALFERAAA
jgi:magnesium-protoporphyrin O-methyltransferase